MSDLIPIVVADLEADEARVTKASESSRRTRFRSYTSVVFLYPALTTCLVCGIISGMGERSPAHSGVVGLVFIFLFFAHLAVLAIDLNRRASIFLAVATCALCLTAGLSEWFSRMVASIFNQQIYMSPSFYWTWFLCLGGLIGASVVWSRTEAWSIKDQALVRTRLLGRSATWPVNDLTYRTTVQSAYKYLLMRSGRLILWPNDHDDPIVLDNVPQIRQVEDYLNAHGARPKPLRSTSLLGATDSAGSANPPPASE
ncbi:MAG: hypothetical protein VX589_05940 [Myxococcota bacterium]|nr:hypothetical protein [Myxococcota bacterium]